MSPQDYIARPMATLDSAMKAAKLGDAQLAAECKPPVHRTSIWVYRKGKKTPRADTARSIIAALKKHGVTLTLDELLGAPRRTKAA
jgi:hypothetical protein